MNPMLSAPKDGTRILLKYTEMHYHGGPGCEWRAAGEKWEECFWDSKYEWKDPEEDFRSKRGRWTPWCGNIRTRSTATIRFPICWLPSPDSPGAKMNEVETAADRLDDLLRDIGVGYTSSQSVTEAIQSLIRAEIRAALQRAAEASLPREG